MNHESELEQSFSLCVLVCNYWRIAARDEKAKLLFEIIIYNLIDDLGDDLICEELEFLNAVNFER